jgi:hypothetical protein
MDVNFSNIKRPIDMMRTRILVLTSTFPRWEGDIELRFVFDLCRGLQSQFGHLFHLRYRTEGLGFLGLLSRPKVLDAFSIKDSLPSALPVRSWTSNFLTG